LYNVYPEDNEYLAYTEESDESNTLISINNPTYGFGISYEYFDPEFLSFLCCGFLDNRHIKSSFLFQYEYNTYQFTIKQNDDYNFTSTTSLAEYNGTYKISIHDINCGIITYVSFKQDQVNILSIYYGIVIGKSITSENSSMTKNNKDYKLSENDFYELKSTYHFDFRFGFMFNIFSNLNMDLGLQSRNYGDHVTWKLNNGNNSSFNNGIGKFLDIKLGLKLLI
ncbi:MAG: hypothetical protein JW982_12910, partial [Spirochaetes bacterium]|nr:hypothetical protein [Spirochaetota bacterium]